MDMAEQPFQGFQNEYGSTVPQVIPEETTNEMIPFSPSCFLPMDEYEDIMSMLFDENDNSQQDQDQASKKSKTFETSEEEDSMELLFQLDPLFSFEEIFGAGHTFSSQGQVGSSSPVLSDIVAQTGTTSTTSTIQLNSNSSERRNISISPGLEVSNASTSTFGERSSNREVQQLGDNMGLLNPFLSSDNSSSSIFSMLEDNTNFFPAGSNTWYPPQAGASFGDSIFPNTTGNSFTQYESPSFSVHPYGGGSPSFGTSACASASGLVGNSVTQFQSPSFPVHPYGGGSPSFGTSASASASGLVGNSVTQFQSPSFPVHPSASPSVGGGAGANNLDGNSLNQFQSPNFPVHPYAGPSVGSGVGANNLAGNSLNQFQSPSFLVQAYAGSSVGSGAGTNNLAGNSLNQFQSPSFPVQSYAGPSVGSGAGTNNLAGNSLNQFQSPSFPVQSYAGPSVGRGSGTNNLAGNSLNQFQSPSFPVHSYAGPSVGSGAGANNLGGNSLNQFQSPSFPLHPYVGPSASTTVGPSASTTVGRNAGRNAGRNTGRNAGRNAGPGKTPIVGTRAGANNLGGNSLTRYQSSSFPVHTYGSASARGIASASSASTDARVLAGASNANASRYGSHQQFTRGRRLEMSRTNPPAAPSAPLAALSAAPSAVRANTRPPPPPPVPVRPQYNQTQVIPREPFRAVFKDFVQAWEGCLIETIHPYRTFFNHAKAWKKPISPIKLTDKWKSRLEVSLYIPRKAVLNTMRYHGEPLDYIFFEVNQFGNLDLYDHLMTNKVYAKIVLPSHTLMLFTTESKRFYMGSVFDGDAVFVEPM